MVEVIGRGRGLLMVVIIGVLVIGFGSCTKDDVGLGVDWNEGVVHFTGEPALDGCGWMLLSEGVEYSLYNMPEDYLVDGLNVWFKGKELREYYACGLSADTYKIYEVEEVKEKPWRARDLDDYPDYETSWDGFSIDSAYVDGDSLRLHVGYSGGCAIHQFNMWILENEDDAPHLMLEHIGNGDMCEAYFHKWIAFSLEEMQEMGENEVVFMMRGSPIMSSLYGPFTYKY